MNCEEYREVISAHVDGNLSPDEEADTRTHLAQCDRCARIFLWEAKATKAIKQKLSTVAIDPNVKVRLLEKLAETNKRSLFGWSTNSYRLAAAVAVFLLTVSSLLFLRAKPSDDLFANVLARHRALVDNAEGLSDGPVQPNSDQPLDLSPWGYRLLIQKAAQLAEINGRAFVFAKAGEHPILVQEFDGGNLSIPAGARTIDAAGKQFVSHSLDGVNLVAWKDKNRLCILAARIPQEALIQVAERLAIAM